MVQVCSLNQLKNKWTKTQVATVRFVTPFHASVMTLSMRLSLMLFAISSENVPISVYGRGLEGLHANDTTSSFGNALWGKAVLKQRYTFEICMRQREVK